jgi:hypothetical protein
LLALARHRLPLEMGITALGVSLCSVLFRVAVLVLRG